MFHYLSGVRYLNPAQDAPAPTETAVIAAVPKAEPVVSEHRQQLDVAAGWGVPAHVTVLYPFVAPEALSDTLITRRWRQLSGRLAHLMSVLDERAGLVRTCFG